MFDNAFENRTVLITGHTGFKGTWLTTWLNRLGANVIGISNDTSDFFKLENPDCVNYDLDVRNRREIYDVIRQHSPEFIFHLAAQPLVLKSYEDPFGTISTNTMGTLNVVDAAQAYCRTYEKPCNLVVITTDKVYDNINQDFSYREIDPLGGEHDPYSASKACAEIITASYRKALQDTGCLLKIATARAGNVIGGGDWSTNRIIPDLVLAYEAGDVLEVRSPNASRPWQHVLEPLSGYLWLAAVMDNEKRVPKCSSFDVCGAFNFGPSVKNNITVAALLDMAKEMYPKFKWKRVPGVRGKEADKLDLSIEKAIRVLQWEPLWSVGCALSATLHWYLGSRLNDELDCYISMYCAEASRRGLLWVKESENES